MPCSGPAQGLLVYPLPGNRRRLAPCSAARALPIAVHKAATRCRAHARLRARPSAAASGAPARRSWRWRCAVLERAAWAAGPRGAPAARAVLARARGGQQGLVPQLERPERAAAAGARQHLHTWLTRFPLVRYYTGTCAPQCRAHAGACHPYRRAPGSAHHRRRAPARPRAARARLQRLPVQVRRQAHAPQRRRQLQRCQVQQVLPQVDREGSPRRRGQAGSLHARRGKQPPPPLRRQGPACDLAAGRCQLASTTVRSVASRQAGQPRRARTVRGQEGAARAHVLLRRVCQRRGGLARRRDVDGLCTGRHVCLTR